MPFLVVLGKQVSAYYADDYVSIIYMILILHCTKEEKDELKQYAYVSAAGKLIVNRRQVLQQRYPKEVIDCLYEIEHERAGLINIDDLHNRCQPIIEEFIKLGLVS